MVHSCAVHVTKVLRVLSRSQPCNSDLAIQVDTQALDDQLLLSRSIAVIRDSLALYDNGLRLPCSKHANRVQLLRDVIITLAGNFDSSPGGIELESPAGCGRDALAVVYVSITERVTIRSLRDEKGIRSRARLSNSVSGLRVKKEGRAIADMNRYIPKRGR